MENPNGKYGIKAYGSWHRFDTEDEFREYLSKWIAGTEGAERDRAVNALANLDAGICETDTDAPKSGGFAERQKGNTFSIRSCVQGSEGIVYGWVSDANYQSVKAIFFKDGGGSPRDMAQFFDMDVLFPAVDESTGENGWMGVKYGDKMADKAKESNA